MSSDIDTLRAEIKKLSTQAIQAKPTNWDTIPQVAERCHALYARLADARTRLKAAET